MQTTARPEPPVIQVISQCRRHAGAWWLALLLLAGCSNERPADLVASAREYAQKNNASAAIIQLKNALQKQPDYAEARFMLGELLLDSNDVLAAEKELKRAAELKYPAAELNAPLARVMVTKGQYQAAIDQFSQAQASTPRGNAQLRTVLGDAYLALGNRDMAGKLYTEAQAADAAYAPAVLGQALVLASKDRLPEALERAQTAAKISPSLPETWQVQGEVLTALGRNDEALAAYRKGVEVRKDYVPSHASAIALLLRENRTDQAAEALAAMKKVAPRHPKTFLSEALVDLQQNNLTGARDAIQEQLRIVPENVQGLAIAGTIDYRLGSYASAESKLLKVLETEPRNAGVRRVLVGTYIDSGQPGKALDTLKPLLVAGGDRDASLLNMAGQAYLRKGQPTVAAEYFKKAAAVDPEGAPQRTGLGLTYIAQGDVERGMQELESAAASDQTARADLLVIVGNIQRGQYDSALTAIDALEKKQPNKAVTENLRGLTLLAKRDIAGARKSFDAAVAREPNFLPATLNLVRIDVAERKVPDAEARLRAFVAKNPSNSEAMVALAQVRAGNGASQDEVTDLIRKAVAANPTAAGPRLALVQHYLSIRQPSKAVGAAQDALSAVPGNPDFLDALGRAQVANRDIDQAMVTFSQVAQAAPTSPVPWQRMAEVQLAQKDFDGAARSLRRALAAKPDLLSAQRTLLAIELNAKRVPQAQSIAKDVQKQRPQEAVGYVLEGDILASKRFWREAAVAYRKGSEQSGPGAVEAAAKLHEVLVANGQAKEAEKVEAAWIKDHPKDSSYERFLGEAAARRGDFGGAMKYYRGALDRRPDDAVVLNNIAWTAGKLNDPRALEYGEQALKLAPEQPEIMDTVGVLLVEKGDAARAVDLLQKATAKMPGNPDVRLHLAEALIKAGRKDAAKKELDELAKLGDKYPRHEEVARLARSI